MTGLCFAQIPGDALIVNAFARSLHESGEMTVGHLIFLGRRLNLLIKLKVSEVDYGYSDALRFRTVLPVLLTRRGVSVHHRQAPGPAKVTDALGTVFQ